MQCHLFKEDINNPHTNKNKQWVEAISILCI